MTLKQIDSITADLPGFHFGANLGIEEFDALAKHVLESGYDDIVMILGE